MLNFLQKIRRSFIESGATRKYLLYGIGEIVLVVIGILIALQINNLNEWRKDRIKEKDILHGLLENFELNIESLEDDIRYLQSLNHSSKIILSVLDNRLPFVDSLDRHFHLARIPKMLLSLSLSGYEQYKNIGYDIILNKEVKNEIITFFESTYPKWFKGYDNVNSQYVPFIDHHVPLFIYKQETLIPIDIEKLYEDDYYIGWIRAYTEGRSTLVEWETQFLMENQRILRLIQRQIR